MKQNSILQLQDKYLETNNERYLNELFNQLQKLGYKIVLQKNVANVMCDSDKLEMVDEIVSSIIIRLYETKTKIFTYPSAFLSRAIYFKTYTYSKKAEGLNFLEEDDNIEDDFHLENNLITQELTNEFYTFLEDTIKFYSSHLPEPEQQQLKREVINCFLLGRPYERYIYKLKKNLEAPFINIFEELKTYHKKYFLTEETYK